MDPTNPYDSEPEAANGYDRSMFKKDETPASLTDAIEAQHTKDTGRGLSQREDPYTDKEPAPAAARSLFGGRMGEAAPLGYAARGGERAQKDGYMFGGPAVDAGSAEDPFRTPKRYNNAKDQAISMSDPAAKREAFIAGIKHTQESQEAGTVQAVPKYMRAAAGPGTEDRAAEDAREARKEATEPHAVEARKPRPAPPPTASHTRVEFRPDGFQRGVDALAARPAPGSATAAIGALPAAAGSAALAEAGLRGELTPEAKEVMAGRPITGDFVGNARKAVGNFVRSDPQTKQDMHHFGGPMAQANRSMEPSSYEYKPEFAEAEGQKPGEKNVGPMADKMEADPVARTAIVKDPETGLLGIDKAKGLKLVMGGLSSVQKQLDELQSGRRRHG